MGRQIIDLTGQKIGNFLVIEELDRKNGGAVWKCKCSCGNVEEIRSIDLTKKRKLECTNCSKLKYMLPRGEAGFKRYFDRLRSRALERGYSFNLSEDNVKTLNLDNCYYCNKGPSQISYAKCKSEFATEHSKYVYNGIDRIDNCKGYEITNVRTCCKDCNFAKREMSEAEFFILVESIYNKHFKK